MSLIETSNQVKVTNVASVPHRSPFRYPGGKTWLVPEVRRWLAGLPARPRVFCEPFCGGATVGLSVLFDGLVDRLVLVELDQDVASVWETLLGGRADELIDRIGRFQISHESVRAVLVGAYGSLAERAFATIVRNRVQRGGILAPGASLMKRGENGRGLASRWYPKTLQKRIEAIHTRRSCITFIHGDGIEYMRRNAGRDDMAFFVDPPYTIAGRRLYVHSDVDHAELFRVASTLRGDFLMTYDEAPPIRELAAQFGFAVHTVPMKNTHHRIMRELLIARDVGWDGE
jgi:DNA adenine methylase